MTDIQVKYAQHLESVRANRARETEQNRANLANEAETKRSNLAREFETNRSNIARETETNRHNLVIENHSLRSLQETERSNRANEAIRSKANDVAELGHRLNYSVQRERNEVTREYNNQLAALKATELEIARDNANTNKRNSETNARQADTAEFNSKINAGKAISDSVIGRAGIAGLVGLGAGKSLKSLTTARSKTLSSLDNAVLSARLAHSVPTFDPFLFIKLPGDSAFDVKPKAPVVTQ